MIAFALPSRRRAQRVSALSQAHDGTAQHRALPEPLLSSTNSTPGLIRSTQGLLASLSAFFDRWILDGAIVRGLSGGTWGSGFLLRLLQVGNLQAYGFLFGLGIIGLIYFTVFH